MFYEVTSRNNIVTEQGEEKTVTQKFIVENAELCAEAENRMLEEYNGASECVCIRQSPIKEFVNERTSEDQDIYLATLEAVYLEEKSGKEKTTRYVVALFHTSTESATTAIRNYLKAGIEDLRLVAIKKTKIVDLLR